MLAAATSFFARTNISTNYNIGPQPSPHALPGFGSGSRSSTPGPGPSGSASTSSTAALPTAQPTPTFHGELPETHDNCMLRLNIDPTVGPWRVQSATHKVTGKRVSVWTYDKRAPDTERMSNSAKEKIVEALKAEVRMIIYPAGFVIDEENRHLLLGNFDILIF